MVQGARLPARLEFTYTGGQATTRFLQHVVNRELVGQRCPSCSKVYIPPMPVPNKTPNLSGRRASRSSGLPSPAAAMACSATATAN